MSGGSGSRGLLSFQGEANLRTIYPLLWANPTSSAQRTLPGEAAGHPAAAQSVQRVSERPQRRTDLWGEGRVVLVVSLHLKVVRPIRE